MPRSMSITAQQAVMGQRAPPPDQGQRPGQGAAVDLRLQKGGDARQFFVRKIRT